MLHNSSWGYLCPAETPEGQSVGVVKNLSYMTHITIGSDSEPIYEYLKNKVIEFGQLTDEQLHRKVKVFVNGMWIGVSDNAYELYMDLKNKKHQGIINIYTSVIFDIKRLEIRICNDGGRLTRPLFKVKTINYV